MYTLPYFGEIDPTQLEEYSQTDINFNATEIDLDLNFESTSIAPERLDLVKKFLENLSAIDAKNKGYIEEDFINDDESAKLYIHHHLEEVEKETLKQLIDFEDISTPIEMQLLKKLKLVRIGFYPDRNDEFVICDYSIGKEITDYVITLCINEAEEITYIAMES